MKDHISKEEFWLEFFGNHGRDLGDPKQFFTDNPTDIIQFVKDCTEQKKPAFISVNPRLNHEKVSGIEKVFFDFDYGSKKDVLSDEEINQRKIELMNEVSGFINWLKSKNIIPLVVKTRKGFHVHVYLQNILSLQHYDLDLYKEMYELLQLHLLKKFKRVGTYHMKYFDTQVLGDVKRICRIPLSIHEKSDEECILVKDISDGKIIRDKVRGLSQYLPYRDTKWVYPVAKKILERKHRKLKEKLERIEEQRLKNKDKWEIKHGFIGKIRPCFQKQMDSGEMGHHQRTALAIEAYFAGYNTPEKMIILYKCFNDWDGDQPRSECRDQVDWFFRMVVPKIASGLRPYTCESLQKYNWCIHDECPLWKKRRKKP